MRHSKKCSRAAEKRTADLMRHVCPCLDHTGLTDDLQNLPTEGRKLDA